MTDTMQKRIEKTWMIIEIITILVMFTFHEFYMQFFKQNLLFTIFDSGLAILALLFFIEGGKKLRCISEIILILFSIINLLLLLGQLFFGVVL